MLKLEKISARHELHVRLRRQEGLFNPIFIKAFAIALFIHFFSFFFFQIQGIKLTGDIPSVPPAIVNVDIKNNAFADVPIEDRLRYPLEPKASLLTLPPVPLAILKNKTEFRDEKSPLTTTAFQQLEGETIPYPQKLSLSLSLLQPIEIQISGNLNTLELLDNGLKQIQGMHFSNDLETPLFAKFHLQMEERTGQIFWYESLQSTDNAELDSLAEKILQKIRFQTSPNGFVTTGEIEIRFNQTILSGKWPGSIEEK